MGMRDPLIGQQLSNFRIERLLGHGGMANVYYGRDVKLQRPVAIKIISSRYQDNADYARRFIQEARAIATWRHENIVQVYYADDDNGMYYFVMEFVDGLDLSTLLKQYINDGELMPIDDVITLGKAVAGALDYAHSKGVVHRDVKPANIMIASDGRIVLMDFGLAMVATQETQGETFGTPHYIAPEQARNSAEAVPQSDLYALGIILYEMIVGAVPFDDQSLMALALKHITQAPPPPREINPTVSEEVEKVLLKALEKHPGDRYQTGAELMLELERALRKMTDTSESSQLPPLPAGHYPSLSQVSIADRVNIHVRASVTPPLFVEGTGSKGSKGSAPRPIPSPQGQTVPETAPARNRSKALLMGGALGLILVILTGIVLFALGGDDEKDTNAQGTQSALNAIAETETQAVVLVGETATAFASITPTVPTNTPTDTATATEEPTATDVPTDVSSTATDAPTDLPPTRVPPTMPPSPDNDRPGPLGQPTHIYPDGRHLTMIYDFNSFYLWNRSGANIAVAPFKFEALDEAGTPIETQGIDGTRWTRFFAFVEDGSCVAAEISDESPWLRPEACTRMNAITNPSRIGPLLFWAPLPNKRLSGFRVLYNDEELAQCPVSLTVGEPMNCEVYLP